MYLENQGYKQQNYLKFAYAFYENTFSLSLLGISCVPSALIRKDPASPIYFFWSIIYNGYDKDENGKLVVVESEAVIVRKIL